MARGFLYIVAGAVLLAMAGLVALRYAAQPLAALAFVPSVAFTQPAPLPANAYARPQLWLARPGQRSDDPTRWWPAGVAPGQTVKAAVFYVHPTSFFDRASWNAPLGDGPATARTDGLVRGQASAFNAATQMWAPRYRQATYGAMLTTAPAGRQALDVAYRDVLAAFDQFVAASDPGLPIVIVGDSQGASHVIHLLQDRVAGTALAARIAAVYLPGWPVSIVHDLPHMGLPACATTMQSGCILSWMSYAEPADPTDTLAMYDRMPGLDGHGRRGSPILCSNPLTGGAQASAPASANLGTLLAAAGTDRGELIGGMVPARCSAQGFLLIGPAPQLGPGVLPGNDYQVYDIALFWANLRRDVAGRVDRWHQTHDRPHHG